jgi:hypothetical protein
MAFSIEEIDDASGKDVPVLCNLDFALETWNPFDRLSWFFY